MSDRGFEKLIGKVVEHVDSRDFQMVHLYLSDGSVVSIDTNGFHYGIPIISAESYWRPRFKRQKSGRYVKIGTPRRKT